jgi:hypothetical protein
VAEQQQPNTFDGNPHLIVLYVHRFGLCAVVSGSELLKGRYLCYFRVLSSLYRDDLLDSHRQAIARQVPWMRSESTVEPFQVQLTVRSLRTMVLHQML